VDFIGSRVGVGYLDQVFMADFPQNRDFSEGVIGDAFFRFMVHNLFQGNKFFLNLFFGGVAFDVAFKIWVLDLA
jgi:hypothetical protein